MWDPLKTDEKESKLGFPYFWTPHLQFLAQTKRNHNKPGLLLSWRQGAVSTTALFWLFGSQVCFPVHTWCEWVAHSLLFLQEEKTSKENNPMRQPDKNKSEMGNPIYKNHSLVSQPHLGSEYNENYSSLCRFELDDWETYTGQGWILKHLRNRTYYEKQTIVKLQYSK